MKNITKDWWKYLSVIITFYVLIVGILTPLKPGIYDFTPSKALTGSSFEININTYNTRFSNTTSNEVYLKLPDDKLLTASTVEVSDENTLMAQIEIPFDLEVETESGLLATLIVDNDLDGYALYPQAIRIKKNEKPDSSITGYLSSLDQIKIDKSFGFPFRNILYETIRNTFFHVAIWFAMFLLLIYSCYNSIQYLRTKNIDLDLKSSALTTVGLWFGIAGILTGSMWAKFTWGTFWTDDIKLNMSAIALLIYFAYWILRNSITDIDSRARIASIYNVFAFVCLMILVMVIPRLTDSLHPGNGGNPALGGEDLDNSLRKVFYPAIIGYTLIGLWMSQLYYRFLVIKNNWEST